MSMHNNTNCNISKEQITFFFRKIINRCSSTNIYVDFFILDFRQYCFYFQIIGTILNIYTICKFVVYLYCIKYNLRFLYHIYIYIIIAIKSVVAILKLKLFILLSGRSFIIILFSAHIFIQDEWKIPNNYYRIHSPYVVIKKHRSKHTAEFITANAGS